jgi:hypothetical protein
LTFTREYEPAVEEVNLYSLIAVPNDGIVTEVIGYQPLPAIRPEDVKLMLGVKVTVFAELLYQVTLIFSPERKLLAVPVTP